ncbi:MAG: riboflavin synthase [Actinomycetota bacterium]|nr:riboflavin synthase [Actinomycetota bacterium]
MFTGIVEELGEVVTLDLLGDSARLTVRGPTVVSDAAPGDSIAVNGCCLTVVELNDETFAVDVMGESLDKTSLGDLRSGSRVNLERAVTAQGRLGGHIVQGHVDGTGSITSRESSEHWDVVWVSLPVDLARYVAMKGSVTVDGVSLTVSGLRDGDAPAFSVSLIPTTLELTTLGDKQVGDHVNLEVDVVAKYVERLLGGPLNSVVERLLGGPLNSVVERLLDPSSALQKEKPA